MVIATKLQRRTVYDLTCKINVDEVERRILEYQKENHERIQLRQAQLAEQERRMALRIKLEKEQSVDLQRSLEVGGAACWNRASA